MVPVWTASQSNRSGAREEIVGLENMGEAYGKAQVSDVVIGLSRKPEEKASGFGRLFLAKNRAGMDGIQMPIRIDTAQSKFRVLTVDEQSDFEMVSNPKKKLNEVWEKVKQAKGDLE